MSEILTSPHTRRFENMLNPLQSKLSELESNLDSIKDDHPYKQQARLDVLEEINKTKQEIENMKKNLECSKTMNRVRSNKIPSNVEDHNVWNDCWYDEERKLFVTYCKYFQEIPGAKDRSHQIQYTEETENSGIVIVPGDVEFRFGYPAVKQKDSTNNPVWYLLSTLNDDMITNDIVLARLRPQSHEESVLYRTEKERWITIGTEGLSLCEKENEISDKLELYPKVPLEELKTLYGRK